MLFVLTCADLAAVGPGVLNDWKVDVLTDDGQVVTSFESSGTGEVRGEAIPEPGTLLLSLLGSLVGCMMALRYRWG